MLGYSSIWGKMFDLGGESSQITAEAIVLRSMGGIMPWGFKRGNQVQ